MLEGMIGQICRNWRIEGCDGVIFSHAGTWINNSQSQEIAKRFHTL